MKDFVQHLKKNGPIPFIVRFVEKCSINILKGSCHQPNSIKTIKKLFCDRAKLQN